MLRKHNIAVTVISLMLSLAAAPASRADDTDIYFAEADADIGLPMVMFTLDYRPNLASTVCQNGECQTLVDEGFLDAQDSYTYFDLLRGVLKKVMAPLEGVRVGLMLNHDYRANCAGPAGERSGCSNGGYIAMGFQEFKAGEDDPAKVRFHNILASIPLPQGNLSHSYQGKELFFEFFRYLTGQGIYNGHNGYLDYAGDPEQNLDENFPAIAWDTEIELKDKKTYISPLAEAGECSQIFTVNPLFFVASQEDDSDPAIRAPLAEGGTGGPRAGFVDIIDFLSDIDVADGSIGNAPDVLGKQSVTSYFIVDPTKINRTTIGYAQAGNTGQPLALSDDPEDLVRTLTDVFKQILSVSTTFVAASVPVNVFNRSEVLDNVYLALFQANSQPYWVGNVKKLKLEGLDSASANVRLVDALGQAAVAADGRLSFEALTFWTDPASLPPPNTQEGEVAGRDGRGVARGGAGAALAIRSPGSFNTSSTRRVFFDDADSLSPMNLDASTITKLGAAPGTGAFGSSLDSAQVSELIAYARGLDIDDLDNDLIFDESRRWIMGDPLHSRPLPINYGALGSYTRENPAIYLAVASNDGYMHMLRNTSPSGAESGSEAWAFMPQRIMDVIPQLRGNASGNTHPYTVDGSPAVYMEDRDLDGTIEVNDGDRVYLYFGLRRGGRSYYALDISRPENPELLWSINGNPDRSVLDPGFDDLGLSFSTPRVGLIPGASGPVPVVIFSGGYDPNKDIRGTVGTDDTMGNSLFVVNAQTGDLIWKASGSGTSNASHFVHPDLVDSIPSTPSAVDMDGDGYLDRILVGDSGGNVWRADINGTDTSAWKLSLLARLGRHGSGGIENDRRFFHRPDVVLSRDGQGAFDAVVLGSGNRADPLGEGGVTADYIYAIKDRQTAVGGGTDQALEPTDLADVTDNCLQSGSCTTNPDLSNGWYIELQEAGEKSLATPLTVGGAVYLTTYIPRGASAAYACSPSEGTGRLYSVRLENGFAVRNNDSTNDDPNNPDQPTSHSDRYEDLASAGIPSEVVSIPPNRILRPDLVIQEIDVSTRWRTYWFRNEETP